MARPLHDLVHAMNEEDQSVKDALHATKKGRGRKIAYLVGAAAAVAIVIGAFVGATRGTNFDESSAAMVEAVPPQNQAATSQDAGAAPSP